MNHIQLLNTYRDRLLKGELKTLEPLLSIFTLEGKPLNLINREPMVPIFTTERPKRMTLLAGRQVSKSFTIAEMLVLMTGFIPGFFTSVIEPRFIQKKRFNSQILAPLLKNCIIKDELIDKAQIDLVDNKIFKSGGQISLVNGFLSADGCRGSTAHMLFLDECQDLLNSIVPVFESITDAKTDTGFRLYSGTAKTSDDTLCMKFEDSSQGHWCVKCECGKYNIFSPDEQLFTMIRNDGCKCPSCSRSIDVSKGFFVHKYPSRVYTHVGYHLPQTAFGFHHSERAWTELIYKKEHNNKTLFLNESLGVPDDESIRLLTKEDILNDRNNIHSLQEAINCIDQYSLKILGVDWGGGGGGDSATGIAVIAKNDWSDRYECLYMTRLKQGLTPEQEAAIVRQTALDFNVEYIAHDYTGAGFIRETLFINKYPEWAGRMYPISYSYKPTADLITYRSSGSRGSWTVDKTKSLLITINSIKYKAMSLPWFDAKDSTAPQLDFLSIIEHDQKIGEGAKNELQKASTVYLLDKVAGRKDDAAQAVNIALMCICNITGSWPIYTFDSKYDITEEQYAELMGSET